MPAVPQIQVDDTPIQDAEDFQFDEGPIKPCPHLKKACRMGRISPRIRTLKDPALRVCRTCTKEKVVRAEDEDAPQLWLCLCCGHLFCGRYDKGHAAAHHERFGEAECLMWSIDKYSCWCYVCDDEIRSEKNKNEVLVQVQKYWQKHAETAQASTEPMLVEPVSTEVKFTTLAAGLQNLGNTCYLNSVLQVLAGVDALHEIISPHPFEERSALEIKSQSGLTSAFVKLLGELYANSKEKAVLKPNALFSELNRRFPQFTRGSQQDAQELLHYLLDGLKMDETQREIGAPLRKLRSRRKTLSDESQDIEMIDRPVAREPGAADTWQPSGYIESIFEGRLASIVVCSACKSVSTTYDQFEELSLPILRADGRGRIGDAKSGGERKSRFRAAFDDIRRSRNLSLTRANLSPGERKHKQPHSGGTAASYFNTLETDETSTRNGALSPRLAPHSALLGPGAGVSLSEAVSEEDEPEADAGQTQASEEKGQARAAFSISEAKKRLERLSFAFSSATRSSSQQPKVPPSPEHSGGEEMSSSMSQASDMSNATTTAGPSLPVPSAQRVQHIQRLLREVEVTEAMKGTIEDCLRDFTAVEVMEGNNAFACEECAKLLYCPKVAKRPSEDEVMDSGASVRSTSADSGASQRMELDHNGTSDAAGKVSTPKYILRKAFKRFLLADLPEVLILHLKRFQQSGKSMYSSLKKVDDIVQFDEYLDVGRYMLPRKDGIEEDKMSTLYQCIGCVVHIGNIHSGHYVAYVLSKKTKSPTQQEMTNEAGSKDKQWIFASDNLVRPATWEEISRSRAYMVFYQRVA